MRGGLAASAIFLACIVLGVATIAGVGSVARGMTEGIAREGRAILGGDVAFALVQRQASPAERAYLDRTRRACRRSRRSARWRRRADGGDQALVEVKAVDGAYPLFGALSVDRAAAHAATCSGARRRLRCAGRAGAVAAARARGSATRSSSATRDLRSSRRHRDEPDRLAGGFAFGPRLMIGRAALDATGLVQPGSLVSWHYRVAACRRCPTTPRWRRSPQAARTAFPTAGLADVGTRDDAAPGLRRNIERFAEFLTLIGLAALIVGGVGVANAVASFLDGKRDVIATLKCLGAPAGFAVLVYLIQILIIAAFGIAIGLVVGAVIPFVAGRAPPAMSFPVADRRRLSRSSCSLAAVYGLR